MVDRMNTNCWGGSSNVQRELKDWPVCLVVIALPLDREVLFFSLVMLSRLGVGVVGLRR